MHLNSHRDRTPLADNQSGQADGYVATSTTLANATTMENYASPRHQIHRHRHHHQHHLHHVTTKDLHPTSGVQHDHDHSEEEEEDDSGMNSCPLLDDQQWSESDLILAAELGKTLLERNRELESRLAKSESYTLECELEIKLLSKQVDSLREVNEQKMRVYEEVDRHSHEMERANEKFRQELLQEQCRYAQLMRTKGALEAQVEEQRSYADSLEAQLQELQTQLLAENRIGGEGRRRRESSEAYDEGDDTEEDAKLSGLRIPVTIGENADETTSPTAAIVNKKARNAALRHHNDSRSSQPPGHGARGRRASSVPNVHDDTAGGDRDLEHPGVKSFWPPPEAPDWDAVTPINHRLRVLQLTSELNAQRQRTRTLSEEVDQLMTENWDLKDQLLRCEEKLRQLHLQCEEERLAGEDGEGGHFLSGHVTPCGETHHPSDSIGRPNGGLELFSRLSSADESVPQDLASELYSTVEHDYPEIGPGDAASGGVALSPTGKMQQSLSPRSPFYYVPPHLRDIQNHASGARVYSPMGGSPRHDPGTGHKFGAPGFLSGLPRVKKNSLGQVLPIPSDDQEWQEDPPFPPSAGGLLPLLWRMRSQTTQVDPSMTSCTSSLFSSQQTSLAGSLTSLTPSGVFQHRLDQIFSQDATARLSRRGLIEEDYKPRYKELFRDAFNLLSEMKEQNAAKKKKAAEEQNESAEGGASSSQTKSVRPSKDMACQTSRRLRHHNTGTRTRLQQQQRLAEQSKHKTKSKK